MIQCLGGPNFHFPAPSAVQWGAAAAGVVNALPTNMIPTNEGNSPTTAPNYTHAITCLGNPCKANAAR